MADQFGVPKVFYNDIQSRNPQIVPIIEIEASSNLAVEGQTPDLFYFSTMPFKHNSFDSINATVDSPPINIYPILLDIPSIRESINFIDKKFKTNSIYC